MVEEIELKRKVFEVVETLGEHSKKVERKGKYFFYKDFSSKPNAFKDYIDGFDKLKVSGIRVPKIFMYDKDKKIVITDFVEGPSVLDVLLEHDLEDDYFDAIFTFNYFMKKEKVAIDFYPSNFKYTDGKLYYLAMNTTKYDQNKSFEKKGIWFWVYSKDFVRSIIQAHLPVDKDRANVYEPLLNKEVTLKVIKFYR